VPNVIRVPPAGWAIASGEPAAAISNGDGVAHRRRHDLRPATDVERLRPCIQDAVRALVHACREAMVNAARHSEARGVSAYVQVEDDR
jgi:hypothetical protein